MATPETFIMDSWLYATLAADPTLASLVGDRIFADVAPEGSAFPFVVYTYQSGRDTVGVGGQRILVAATYQVKVIDQVASFAPLKTAATRIDAVLHGRSGSTPDGQVFSAVRESPVRYAEVTDGIQYRHLGGLYRLQAQSN